MLSKFRGSFLVLHVFCTACDSLVTTAYEGEARFDFAVSVDTSTTNHKEALQPVLASLEDANLHLGRVQTRALGTERFLVQVLDLPTEKQLAPLDPWLAPETLIAENYIAAASEQRIGQTIDLWQDYTAIYPDCLNGSCDVLPRPDSAPEHCSAADPKCLREMLACGNGRCESSGTRIGQAATFDQQLGFSRAHMLVYLASRVPAHSWAALKLGAPAGLDSGYHLTRLLDVDSEQSTESSACKEAASTEVLERFNAQHETDYTLTAISCLRAASDCGEVEVPSGAASRELASAVAAAEVEQGCLEIAPLSTPISLPAREQIIVEMGIAPPRGDSVPPLQRTLIASDDP